MIAPGAPYIAIIVPHASSSLREGLTAFADVTTFPSGGVILLIAFIVVLALAVLFANRAGAFPRVTGDVLDAPSLDMPLPAGTALEGDDVVQAVGREYVV